MFKCIEVKDPEMIKEIYRFRYQILCEEFHIFNKEDYPDGLEEDDYDKYSIQYAVYDKNNEIAGCMRLVHHSPIGYPSSNALKVYEDEKENLLPDDKTGELSRIFIRKDCRGMRSSRKIIEAIKPLAGQKLVDLDLVYTYGALEESFMRFLIILKMPYRRIGPFKNYGNRMRALCVMNTKEYCSMNKEFFLEAAH